MNTMAAISKTNDRPVIIISAIFLLVSMICLIINYSVNRSISWSLFPIGALIVVWAMIVPLILMDNNKSLGVFVGLAATLIPYLF
jgi:membrane protein YdbS with pleckstrin-like domain